MPSHHAIVDRATVRLGSLLVGDDGFFARSVDSPGFDEMLQSVSVSVPSLTGEGIHKLSAEMPVGTLDVGIKVAQWVGTDYPTVVYHHGNDERPFSSSRFTPNTFRDILVDHADQLEANIVGLRAPFHDGMTRDYARKMGDLANFVAMLATSVRTVDGILDQRAEGPVIVAGVSLGGWVTNLHRAYEGTADLYVPMLAGAALGKLFTKSAYRRLLGRAGRANPEAVEQTLDFDEEFRRSDAGTVYPLLARHDRYVEYDLQRQCYGESEIAVVERGHITATLNPTPLREHLHGVIRGPSTSSVDICGPVGAPAVVFVHGAGISRKLWVPQIESLSGQYRTIAPDLPGHGDRIDEPFRFEGAVETVEAILADVESDCIVLVGQSLGGYVATEVAARNPDEVAGLVLSGSSADYRGLLGIRTTGSSILFRLGARIPGVEGRFERTMAQRLRSLPLSDAVIDEILRTGLSLDAWGQSGLALVGKDFPSRLSTFGGPICLINGEDDRINRPAATDRCMELLNATPVVVRDAGHTVNLERPAAYTDIVRELVTTRCECDGDSFREVL
ncbi:alpha/beta hydrolase [Haloarcula sp. S1AR25-5A]|uniref:Alpha/beta hydrolase n=1 Tax=Haloarcula terrestris TaxID=2950533 RepID=A0AAE4EZJ7_9EURY|nr:alpha/beta hydrolase [Haloarcula terrestris]MDS0222279.1 alpha/beta hydrolase [Haloarcula terrestris]